MSTCLTHQTDTLRIYTYIAYTQSGAAEKTCARNTQNRTAVLPDFRCFIFMGFCLWYCVYRTGDMYVDVYYIWPLFSCVLVVVIVKLRSHNGTCTNRAGARTRLFAKGPHIRRSVLCASVLAILHWVIGLHERAECHFSDGPFCG